MLKKGLFALIVSGLILFSACGDEKKEGEEGKEKDENKTEQPTENKTSTEITVALPDGTIEHDLSELSMGIKASVQAPESAYIYDSEYRDEEATYNQIIVQMDDASSVNFVIGPCKKTLDELKKHVQDDMFREFTQFLVEDENGFVYEAKKKSDEVTVYHFVMLVENEGNTYQVYSDTFNDYTIEEAGELYAMAKTLTFK